MRNLVIFLLTGTVARVVEETKSISVEQALDCDHSGSGVGGGDVLDISKASTHALVRTVLSAPPGSGSEFDAVRVVSSAPAALGFTDTALDRLHQHPPLSRTLQPNERSVAQALMIAALCCFVPLLFFSIPAFVRWSGSESASSSTTLDADGTVIGYDNGFPLDPFIFFKMYLPGSVLTDRRIWRHIVFLLSLWTMLVIGLGMVKTRPTEVSLDGIERARNYLTAFVTFLLGFFLANMHSRWWEMRMKGIGSIWGNSNSLAILGGVFLSDIDEEQREVAAVSRRYFLAMHAMAYKKARGDESRQDLVERGLLTPKEVEIFEENVSSIEVGFQLQTLCVWGAQRWVDLYSKGTIPKFACKKAVDIWLETRGALGYTFAVCTSQVNYSYVLLMSVLIHGTNVVNCIAEAFLFDSRVSGVLLRNGVIDATLQVECVTVALRLLFTPLIYLGFLQLSTALANPLLLHENAFPQDHYQKCMSAESAAIRCAALQSPHKVALSTTKTKDHRAVVEGM